MVSKVKLYAQLDRLESEFFERLVPHLENGAKGDNGLIFCVPEFNPFPELSNRTDAETEELISLGRAVLALKKKLGESSDDSPAALLCVYCRRWGDLGDAHRPSAKGLAREFLDRITGR